MSKIAYKITERRAGDVASCYADPTLAEKELGWKTERTLDEMCKSLRMYIFFYHVRILHGLIARE
jgi:UDP-glucose 4-epimerase